MKVFNNYICYSSVKFNNMPYFTGISGDNFLKIPLIEKLSLDLQNLQSKDIPEYLEHISKNAILNGIEYPIERIQCIEKVLQKITSKKGSGIAYALKDKNGKIISSCIIDYFQDYECPNIKNSELMGVYTASEFQNKGIVKCMLTKIFQAAKMDNCENVYLYVRTQSAKHVYEKLGFVPVLPPEYNGRVLMKKKLI